MSNLFENDFDLQRFFAPVSFEQWKQQTTQDLKGKDFEKALLFQTMEGISIPSLVSGNTSSQDRARPFPSSQQAWKSTQWLDLSNQAWKENVLQYRENGVNGFYLQPEWQSSPSVDSFRSLLPEMTSNETLLSHVPITKNMLSFLQTSQDCRWDLFQSSPFSLLTQTKQKKELKQEIREFVELTQRGMWKNSRFFGVNDASFAFASLPESLGVATCLAQGLWYLQELSKGSSVQEASEKIFFSFSVDSNIFQQVAKIRCFNILWQGILVTLGCKNPTVSLHIQPNLRSWTVRDPWINLLRNTAVCLIGGLVGGEQITTLPHDLLLPNPSELGNRMARNTQHILSQEAGIGSVLDPMGGSFWIEEMTQKFQEKSWQDFQQIEQKGGILEAVSSPWFLNELETSQKKRQKALQHRKVPITGVSEYPLFSELPPSRIAFSTNIALPTGQNCQRDAEVFESLWMKNNPTSLLSKDADVFLATLGTLAEYNPRVLFTQNLLAIGGLQSMLASSSEEIVLDEEALVQAFEESQTQQVILCGTDASYVKQIETLVPKLREKGAKNIWVAGKANEKQNEWKWLGVDGYLFLGCNVVEVLQSFQKESEKQ